MIQVKGFHFFEDDKDMFNRDAQYLIKTFMNQLENGTVMLPAGPGQPPMEFTMKELGIYCPLIAADRREVTIRVPDLDFDPSKTPATTTSPRTEGNWRSRNEPDIPMVNRTVYEFTVQFMWLETRASERLEVRKQKQQQSSAESTGDVAGDF